MSWDYLYSGGHERAIVEAEYAISRDPETEWNYSTLGIVLYLSGRHPESLNILKKAISLSPSPTPDLLSFLAWPYIHLDKKDEAVAIADKAVKLGPQFLLPRTSLAAASAAAGDYGRASKHAEEVLKIEPQFSVTRYAKGQIYKNPKDLERALDALRKAGLK